MKKIIFSIVILSFLLSSCSVNKDNITSEISAQATTVENMDFTLKAFYGDRSGIYSGEVLNSIPNGQGTFTAKNTEGTSWTYTGDFKNGHFQGNGVTSWDTGEKQEGLYENDAFVNGKFYATNGDFYHGIFENNMIKEGKWYASDGTILYEGIFENGMPKEEIHDQTIQQLEVVDYGYSTYKNSTSYYLNFSAIFHNPNTDIIVYFFKYRITAYGEDGSILGTSEDGENFIWPNSDIQSVESVEVIKPPASIKLELLPIEDRNLVVKENQTYEKLLIHGDSVTPDKFDILGEVENKNTYDLENVKVLVIFKDSNGKLLGGNDTIVSNVSKNSKVAFKINIRSFKTVEWDSFEVFAFPLASFG